MIENSNRNRVIKYEFIFDDPLIVTVKNFVYISPQLTYSIFLLDIALSFLDILS